MFSSKIKDIILGKLKTPSFSVFVTFHKLSRKFASKTKANNRSVMTLENGWINIDKYFIYPWSISGVETCIVIKSEELNVAFDLGYSCKQSINCKHVFLSHGHMDHISGVPQHAAKRSLYGMPPAKYYTPEHLVDTLASVSEGFAKLSENMPVLDQLNIIPVKIGESIHIGNNYLVKPFPTVHRVRSQGYILYEEKKKLKQEFHGLPSHVIAQKIREGVQVKDEEEIPEIAFTGDTTFEIFQNLPTEDLLRVKVLIMETTYIDDEPNKNMTAKARERGHTHLQELAYYAQLFENVHSIILIHFSDKYSPNYIKDIVRETLPDFLVNKVHVATIAKEKYG